MDVKYKVEKNYLLVQCSGEWDMSKVTDFIIDMRHKAMNLNQKQILVDWRNVSEPKSTYHRILAGKDLATFLKPPLKIAAIGVKAYINKIAEKTATERGANFFITHIEDEAIQWLLNSSENQK